MKTFPDFILKEAEIKKKSWNNEKIQSLYFGGGTPSLVSVDEIKRIISSLEKIFPFDAAIEITLEANPDDLSKKYISELKTSEVNRLSIGVQSFQNDELVYLGRIHDAEQAEFSIKFSQDIGFRNLSIDLIYGLNLQKNDSLIKNVKTALSYAVPHISAYCLTIEENTLLSKKIKSKTAIEPSDEISSEEFVIIMDLLNKSNYIHYEISNWAMEGFFSKHNSSYWKGKNYLGLGPSAHSYNGHSRHWNTNNLLEYLYGIDNNEPVITEEFLDVNKMYNEYIMLGLRTMWGCSLNYIESIFGFEKLSHTIMILHPLLEKKYCERIGDTFYLTNEGKLFADLISTEFFFV